MPYSFALSLAAADILLEHCGLGRAPVPFEVPHLGTSHSQRAQIRDAVFRDLQSRGIVRGGRLDAEVRLALATFVHSPVAIAAAARLGADRTLFARAASDGEYAVLARRADNLIVFEQARPTAIVPAIVDLLPLIPAAPGQSVTIPKPAGTAKRAPGQYEGYDPFAGVARPRSQPSAQLRAVERMFEKPRLRIGQFTAFLAGRSGHPVGLNPVAWFDTEAGRYLMTVREAEDGQRWTTYAPADNARLAQQLYQQLEGHF
jgi:hypothetical protein